MRKTNAFLLSFLSLCLIAGPVLPAAAAENFNPNNIISDFEILDSTSMNEADIQALLVAKRSFLATYMVTDPSGQSMTAAHAIYDRAVTNRMNPKFIIVMLQKEQSLIEDASPSQGQLDWALGYGCPDGGGCNDRWRGLWKQINSATLQFRDYMDNPQSYRYRAGQTYTVTNTGKPSSVITPENQATAALYNYTPHVYNGNYNFWKIWQRYFTRDYLNGSLLQASGEAGVWLIENGIKRPFLTKSALTSRFDPSRIQIVSRADLDKYPTGDGIKFAQYSIVRIPTGQIYLLVDSTKRRFTTPAAFKKMGFNPEEVIAAQAGEVMSYADGEPITELSVYPTGALLQDSKTGGVYWVIDGKKAPLWDAALLRTKFKNRRPIRVAPADLAAYATTDPVRLADGDLVRTPESSAVYVIENGVKRPFLSAGTFEKLGYKWTNVFTVSSRLLSLHADGALVSLTQ